MRAFAIVLIDSGDYIVLFYFTILPYNDAVYALRTCWTLCYGKKLIRAFFGIFKTLFDLWSSTVDFRKWLMACVNC